jgi:hypothetical protein
MFVAFSIAGVVVVVAASNGTVPWSFAGLVILALLWNAYWFLWRIGYSIEVDGRTALWRSVLRRRSVPLSDLTGNGSSWPNFSSVTVRDGQALVVTMTGRGWADFLERLNEVESDLRFQPAGIHPASMGGMNGFYENSETGPLP